MKTALVLAAVFLILSGAPRATLAQATNSDAITMDAFGKPWKLLIDSPGFQVKKPVSKTIDNGVQPDGRVYLLAQNATTKVNLSVFLEKVRGKATVDGCKKAQQHRLTQNVPYDRQDASMRMDGDLEIVEYTMTEMHDASLHESSIRQRSIFACIARDDVYVDIHLSKTNYTPEDEQAFKAVLTSVHFVDKATPDAKSTQP
jgi:hypothetical protein